jgi:hypothetical protein
MTIRPHSEVAISDEDDYVAPARDHKQPQVLPDPEAAGHREGDFALSSFSESEISRRTLERRAVEAAIWGMPIVSVDAMRQAFFRDAGARYNDIVYLSNQADWKFQITTPNASSWYVYIPTNTKQGPVVVEIPPATGAGLFGSFNDAWQVPKMDVGSTGEDGGRGARYLVLPPAYDADPPEGFIPVRLKTYNGYAFLRAIPTTPAAADVARAVDLVKSIRVHSLSLAARPPPQRCIDIAGKLFDGIARFDATFYDSLARMVDEEPVQKRDLVGMAGLRSLGIEKGRPFKPSVETREFLGQAILEARAGFMQTIRSLPAFVSGSRWAVPASQLGMETGFTFETGSFLDIDTRGQLFFFGCAPARKPGAATFHLIAMKDVADAPLRGERKYRLRIPAEVPARQFWATTVYDFETAGFVREAPRVELNSYNREMRRNGGGSVDIYFGPRPPEGREANWITTPPGKPWFAIFRFYGPRKALFEKTWVLPDIEELT